MIGAISLDGMGPMMTVEGGTTGDVFYAYVEQLLAPTLQPGDLVIWDNLGAHKDARIKPLIEARGAKVVFQPAYSPDLNPIELAWSKLKDSIRSAAPRTREALDRAIAWAMSFITRDDAAGWFKHCGWKVPA